MKTEIIEKIRIFKNENGNMEFEFSEDCNKYEALGILESVTKAVKQELKEDWKPTK